MGQISVDNFLKSHLNVMNRTANNEYIRIGIN